MSLVSIVADVCAEVGVNVPTNVINNTDANVAQMLRLLNREGKWCARAHDWQILTVVDGTFTTLAANLQVANIVSTYTAFDRFIPKTMWDRTEVRRIEPMTGQAFTAEKANAPIASVTRRYIVQGGALYLSPIPPAGNSVYFDYVKKYWCQSSGGTGKVAFTADDDTGILDEDLLTQGLLWRFLKAKELDYGEEFRRYELMFSALTGQQMPAPDINITPTSVIDFVDPVTPEANW